MQQPQLFAYKGFFAALRETRAGKGFSRVVARQAEKSQINVMSEFLGNFLPVQGISPVIETRDRCMISGALQYEGQLQVQGEEL